MNSFLRIKGEPKEIGSCLDLPAREAMVSDTRDRSRDKATLPKQLPERACQEARCRFWKTVFRGWASGFSAFHLQRRKVVASGSPSLPFQKVLFISVSHAHRGIRGF